MVDFTVCPYCGIKAVLVGGCNIYPEHEYLHKKKFWLCRPCDAYVGVHKESKKFAPLGRLANKDLRLLKMEAHSLLDPYWKSGMISRSDLYERMAIFLGIKKNLCHIGYFDEETCQKVIDKLKKGK